MTTFAGKTAASPDKVRGGYYTPAAVARFLARWVRAAGPKILEPSCGDGAILRELAALSKTARGVELVAPEAAKARAYAPVDTENLFTLVARQRGGRLGRGGGQPALHPLRQLGSRATRAGPGVDAAQRPSAHPVDQRLGPLRRREHHPDARRRTGGPGAARRVASSHLRRPVARVSAQPVRRDHPGDVRAVGVRRHPAGGRVVLRCRGLKWHRPGADTHGAPRRRRRPGRRRARRPTHSFKARAAARIREVDKVLPAAGSDPAAANTQALRHHDLTRPGGRRGRRHRDRTQQLLHLHRRPSPSAGTDPALRPARLAQHAVVRPGLRQ